MKQWDEAARSYRRYLDLVPGDAAIWVQLGHAEKEQDNLVDAEKAYRRAAALAPRDAELRLHLGHLLKRLDRTMEAADVFVDALKIDPIPEMVQQLNQLGYGSMAAPVLKNVPNTIHAHGRYFELKDLFQYLSSHVTVTGITRVVLGLIKYVLEDLDRVEAKSYQFVHQFGDAEGVAFGDGEGLALLSKEKLRRLVHLATTASGGHLGAMVEIIADMRRTAPLVKLKLGDLYFMPGAFWEFAHNPSWLLSMKERGVYIGALFYDLIPLTHTHFCMSELTDMFNVAFAETARFCDLSLTISEFVAEQVSGFLRDNGVPKFSTIAVPLAHELRFEGEQAFLEERPSKKIESLSQRPFVLCVCTIEARKNHIYLFYIWQQMIDAGVDVPDLVFVGRPGWRVSDLIGQIEASRKLDGKLHIINGLSDSDLAALYKLCRFTVFPSFVEGWGLPVGESLSYGKVCVASNTSSIPEVGGDFAVYIDPYNLHSGYEVISRLITEPDYLKELEAKIRKEFIPRTWKNVARDFFEKLDSEMRLLPPPTEASLTFLPHLVAGEFIEMEALHEAGRLRRKYTKNPTRIMFREGWRAIERTGTWFRGHAAKIRFMSDYEAGREISIILLVSTSPWITDEATLKVWACENPSYYDHSDSQFRYIWPAEKNSRFWIRMKGIVGERNVVTIHFQLDGPPIHANPGALPVAVRLHAMGFGATDDVDARSALLDRALIT